MIEGDFITVGSPAAIEASPGFQAWLQRRGRVVARPSSSPAERGPRMPRGGAAPRLAIRRRDLELRGADERLAPPLPASPVLTLTAASNGHFFAPAIIGGRGISMVVDTGATLCSLTEEDAEHVGIRPRARDFTRALSTQNGSIKAALIRVDGIRVGAIGMRNVEAVVTKSVPGAESLLGMSFLRRLREFSMESGRFTLRG